MNTRGLLHVIIVVVTLTHARASTAQDGAAEATPDQTQYAQMERLRHEVAKQIHLKANDLVDELVFGWLQSPPFATPTAVVVADVTAPVGFGSGLEAIIENHLAQVLLKNPGTNVTLAHCPSCQALVVHSDATGTVIGRGIDQPKALETLRGSSGAAHALFLDFEAEGPTLVLRARMTQLTPTLPIVYARTLSSATSTAALLRSPMRLVSAEEARAEYLAILNQQSPFTIPVRIAITAFAPAEDAALQIPLPIPWLQVGVEYAITSARAWTGSLVAGVTFIPTLQTGAMVQVRGARLLTGSEASLTHPNLYAFVGASLAIIQGDTASVLNPPPPPPAEPPAIGPIASYIGLQSGLELRISKRLGASIFIETMPTLYEADNVGNHLDTVFPDFEFGVIQINSIGAEATFAF